jgi:dTDP-4-dehydrorhamnose 3,5-epimerase
MKTRQTEIPGVFIIEPRVFRDDRGAFFETWREPVYRELGIMFPFVQDNVSHSARGTLRGLHFQEPDAQGKLVQVLEGQVFDVAVDIRRGSPTFGRWVGVELDADSARQMWIPPGFAHGFYVMSAHATFLYKCSSSIYSPQHERTIRWDDPALAITWPIPVGERPLVSPKDAAAATLEGNAVLPRYEE